MVWQKWSKKRLGGTVPGANYILTVADYPKAIVESDESNNANGFPITVVP